MMPSSTAGELSSTSPWQRSSLHIDGLSIRYQVGGEGPPVLLLHGWGGSLENFTPVCQELVRSHTVYALDFPGFGQSSLPPAPWGVANYAALTLEVMDRLQLDRPHFICHSFGGRVAIMLAAQHPDRVGKLVLVASAGVRGRRSLKARIKWLISRLGKVLGLYGGRLGAKMRDRIYRRIESQDYANAGSLRPTLVKVINEDLTPLLPRIASSTLLVWGENDREVPLSAAKVMARLIPQAELVVFENAGHFPYIDQFNRFRLKVGRFLRDEASPPEDQSQ